LQVLVAIKKLSEDMTNDTSYKHNANWGEMKGVQFEYNNRKVEFS
jgi:hypothetical protein